ncbi:SIR2 family protein [Corynebacterium sp. P7003]|uniref:SIR2 family protein n=1 Tax=Corynebacterium pygosceleis TaxID=2800406 RepID=A0ABT3WUI7_9CORY|nr:SIR2 family protein [Corynebacterium pygosceleis]MCX7444604.1 SIR2 family protein [Corynebacterium pygosceleis]
MAMELDYTKFRSALKAGDYQLLLGSGSSVGARVGGKDLKNAPALAEHLRRKYLSATSPEDTPLRRIYQRVLNKIGEVELYAELRRLYHGTVHQEWYNTIAALPWSMVWTLNIDDTFERAYDRVYVQGMRELGVVHWKDEYCTKGDLQVVHLHGHVNDVNCTPLVFSFSEYDNHAAESPVWGEIFKGKIIEKPTIIIGARIFGDQDIESAFLNGIHSGRRVAEPTIYVDPSVKDDDREELENNGIYVLKMTAEQFVEHIENEMRLDLSAAIKLSLAPNTVVPQFKELSTIADTDVSQTHDYLGGDIPSWGDALKGLIARRSWMRKVAREIDHWVDSQDRTARLDIVYAQRLSGLSSGLLGICKLIIRPGVQVFIFDRRESWNPDLMPKLVKRDVPTIVVIDGGAEYGDLIDASLVEAQSSKLPLLFLVGETSTRYNKLEDRLLGEYPKTVHPFDDKLKAECVSSLLSVLRNNGRLGVIESKSSKQQSQYFKNREIFDAMMGLEEGVGFHQRMSDLLMKLEVRWHRELVFIVSLCSGAIVLDRHGESDISGYSMFEDSRVPVTVEILEVGLNLTPGQIRAAIKNNDVLSALIEVVDGRVFSRQRVIFRKNIAALGEVSALCLLQDFLKNISVFSNESSRLNKNLGAAIPAHLMTQKFLTSVFPDTDLTNFYDGLKDAYGSNHARYWEQRAIYCKKINNWGHAISFAGKAISIYDDSFTRTTAGTIFINRAQRLLENPIPDNQMAWFKSFTIGVEHFKSAQRHHGSTRVSYIAQLNATISLLKSLDSMYKEGVKVPANNSQIERIYITGKDCLVALMRSSISARGLRTEEDITWHMQEFDSVAERVRAMEWIFGPDD